PQALAAIEAISARRRTALLARAANDDRALVAVLTESLPEADAQERGGESVQSGLLVHEELADALGRLGQLPQARDEYANVLTQHPNRAHSLLGAARIATRMHDTATAHQRFQELAKLWATAAPGTKGLDEVRSTGDGANVLR